MNSSPTSPRIAAAAARVVRPPAIPAKPLPKESPMKRFHVNLAVDDLAQSVRFYSTLFATEPTVLKPDYAKWMLEDPRVNFSISTASGRRSGISHLGIQAEDEGELAEIYGRLAEAERPVVEERATTCCWSISRSARRAGAALGFRISVSRPKMRVNWPRSTAASPKPSARSSRRGRQPAAGQFLDQHGERAPLWDFASRYPGRR